MSCAPTYMATQDLENGEEFYEESSINSTDHFDTNLQKPQIKRPYYLD